MITFIIIVITIILIVKASKPDKHNTAKDHTSIARNPAFTIYGKETSPMEQLSDVILSEHVIVIFEFNNGKISIQFKDGGTFSAALSDMSVTFMYTNHRRFACMKAHGQEKWIQESKKILTNEEWNRIFNLLTLSGETYYADSISKKSREETDGIERSPLSRE